MSDKAYLKATREQMGISQEVWAEMLGVQKRKVQAMEQPNANFDDPDPEIIEKMRELKADWDNKVIQVVELVEQKFPDAGTVQLTYWKSQVQMNEFGRDEGDWLQINAISRAVATILESEGYTIEWSYPLDDDNINKADRMRLADARRLRAQSGAGNILDV